MSEPWPRGQIVSDIGAFFMPNNIPKLTLATTNIVHRFENLSRNKFWEIYVEVKGGWYLLRERSGNIGQTSKRVYTMDKDFTISEMKSWFNTFVRAKLKLKYVFVGQYGLNETWNESRGLPTIGSTTEVKEIDIVKFTKAIFKRTIKINNKVLMPWTMRS